MLDMVPFDNLIGTAHVVEGSYSFMCTPTCVVMNEMNHAALCFLS